MEPEFHTIPLASNQVDDEARMNELIEDSLKYQTFNKNEIKYLYHSLIDNCIYFLDTTYETLYNVQDAINQQEFRFFIENILRRARITIPLLYSIMYYIKRLRTAIRKNPKVILGLQNGLTINNTKDLQKVFITAALLSLKFFNDRVILNSEWTKFIDVTVEEINLCERQFVKLINFNLNLNVKNYYIFINDYLKKLNKSKSLPLPKSYISNSTSSYLKETRQHTSPIQPQTLSIQPQTLPVNIPMYSSPSHINSMVVDSMDNSMNNYNNTSSAKAFLSVTPTPSVGSQINNTPSGERVLTPVENNATSLDIHYNNNNTINNNNTNNLYNNNNGYYDYNNNNINNNYYNNNNNNNNNYINYNNNYSNNFNNGYQMPNQLNSSQVLFSDPEQITPQQSKHLSYISNTSYSTIMRSNTESTYVAEPTYNNNINNNNSYSHSITSPQFYCNSICNQDSNNNNNNMTILPTPKTNLVKTMSHSSDCTLYPSMDEDYNQNQEINNNRIPLNKLLYHNLHQRRPSCSSMQLIQS